MKYFVVFLVLFTFLAIAADKPKYEKRYKVEIQKIEEEAKELDTKQAEAEKFLQQIKERRLVLQGAYAVYTNSKDSVLVVETPEAK